MRKDDLGLTRSLFISGMLSGGAYASIAENILELRFIRIQKMVSTAKEAAVLVRGFADSLDFDDFERGFRSMMKKDVNTTNFRPGGIVAD